MLNLATPTLERFKTIRRAPMRRQAIFSAPPAQPFGRSVRRQAPLTHPLSILFDIHRGIQLQAGEGAGRPWRDAPQCTRAAPPGPPGRRSPASPHNKPSGGSHAPRSRVNPPPWPGCREPARTHRPRPAHNAPPHPHSPCRPPTRPGESRARGRQRSREARRPRASPSTIGQLDDQCASRAMQGLSQ